MFKEVSVQLLVGNMEKLYNSLCVGGAGGRGTTNFTNPPDHKLYTVCHSVCIFWTHGSMVKPHGSKFWIITATFGVFKLFGFYGIPGDYVKILKIRTAEKNAVLNHLKILIRW